MRNAFSPKRAVAVVLAGAMLFVAERGLAASAPGQSDVHALLDVPYVSQTPALCGGAAVAMVLRYWGERGVFPQDFASLTSAGDEGILTGALASAVRDRGWQAFVMSAGEESARVRIRSDIDRGRPLIALIEVGPSTYHYVVIVGTTDHEVVVHDPARAPYRVVPWAEFDRAWAATRRWMMLVLPPAMAAAGVDVPRAIPVTPAPSEAIVPADLTPCGALVASSRSNARPCASTSAGLTPCGALVARGVDLALTGDRDGAEQGLVAATRLCPPDAASWRELAGLRFSQARWSEAHTLALAAVQLAPDDGYAWQLVAASRYLCGDLMGALDAWNRAGEPRLDTTDIHGADRTRQPIVVRTAGLQPRQVLTSEAFGRALRRLRDLPVASNARMKYEPITGGLAKVDVFIDERKVLPSGWRAIATVGGRALIQHELRVETAGPLGAGELATATWRWAAGRPRVALALALPSPQWLPGIVSLDGSWERQSYDATPSLAGTTLVREDRRRVGLHLADWSTSWLWWQTGVALDRLREYEGLDETRVDRRDYLAVESTLHLRLSGDRLAVAASVGWWTPFTAGQRFGTAGLLAAWRSTADATVPFWSAVAEIAVSSREAPLALWQGAGTGHGRGGLLRAHPLHTGGVLTGQAFGRDVANGSLEYVRPVARAFGGGLSVAGFVDTARAWHRMNGLATSPLYVDAGVGVRVRAPGHGSVIRIDVAHGLHGGGTTLSASWGGAWPR